MNIFNYFFLKLKVRVKAARCFFNKQHAIDSPRPCPVLGIAMRKKAFLLFPDIRLLGLFKIWECLLYGCYILILQRKRFTRNDSSISKGILLMLSCGVK